MRDLAAFTTMTNAAAKRSAGTRLSILIPFYKDDPTPLMTTLNTLIGARCEFEILLLDDGCPDMELNAAVARTLRAMVTPARLISAADNIGRSEGRNLLAREARGDWLLYLDADMQPCDDAFLTAYLERIEDGGFDAAFGGYVLPEAAEKQFELHAALARSSDHSDAGQRNEIGATAFCSSNLLVRREVMQTVPFDSGFTGWGWEDVDWAVRAGALFRLIHLDNAARHDGLQPVDTLLAKYREGAVNYARLLEKHPELDRLPGAKAARLLGAVPFQSALRGIWSALAMSAALPMRLRTLALKLWRASWTAEAI
ncbi:glycosyltransferase family 2 protein [Maricaulis sp.]|uniref:glycosyltransferase family 2 protein n=1 Tax=Maricaulis sp. TaxID=1486257 RepID=UPI002619CADC|nr:glycosyltransferase family 2 protein [Maricaulis sp.]